jgi:hypothetical protein
VGKGGRGEGEERVGREMTQTLYAHMNKNLKKTQKQTNTTNKTKTILYMCFQTI